MPVAFPSPTQESRARVEDVELTADIAPPHSILLIMDRSVGRVPKSMAGGLVSATSTCIAVGTLSEHDGTTRVTLGSSFPGARPGPPAFEGVLETPGLALEVCTVFDDVVLRVAVATLRTRVLIWANDQAEPSDIRIVVSAAGRESS